MYRRLLGSARASGLFLCAGLLALGCGEPEVERFPDLEEAAPLTLRSEQAGVGLFHGDALGAAINRDGDALQKSVELFDHAFFRVKSYDELSVVVGEFHAQRIRDEQVSFDVRGPTAFPSQGTSAARLAPRAGDIVSELDYALNMIGAEGFSRRSFVVDFWRERGDWFVRWDGRLTEGSNIEGEGTYGFDRAEMSDDLLDHLAQLAEAHTPDWIVVGDAMDRLLAHEGYEAGVSEEQFEAFFEFFQAAVERIHEASPETRVAAGFHWENVAERLVRQRLEIHEEDDFGLEELDQVFEEVVLPFVEAGDGLALRIYERRENLGEDNRWKYQFLRRLEHLYEVNKPIVIYSAATPISSQAEYPQQRLFVQDLADALAGVQLEAFAWERLTNIDGIDTGDQSVVGRCQALSNPEGRIQMDQRRCLDGLFRLFFAKDVFGALQALVENE